MKKVVIIFIIFVFHFNITNAQWYNQSSGTLHDLNSVSFVSHDTGYVVGNNGTILKTVDGGANWNALYYYDTIVATPDTVVMGPGTDSLNSVFCVNANNVYVVGRYGTILKTSDGGANWIRLYRVDTAWFWPYSIFRDTISYLSGVFFTSLDTGYIVGSLRSAGSGISDGLYLKTTNAGMTWHIFKKYCNTLHSIYFPSKNIGFTVGDFGEFCNTNGAITACHQTGYSLYSVFFTDTDIGYTVGHQGRILKTTNGGSDFNYQTFVINYYKPIFTSVYFPTSDIGYVAGYIFVSSQYDIKHGIILKTTDAGLSWSTQLIDSLHALNSIYFTDSNTAYAVGKNGTILKTTNGGSGLGIEENTVQNDFIYPNPNDGNFTTTVYYKDMKMNIYNLSGELIHSELILQKQHKINLTRLGNAIYIIEFRSNDIIQKGKLVIQK
jgi:photosystem II stability/assembly factor-like uncharacterized protein